MATIAKTMTGTEFRDRLWDVQLKLQRLRRDGQRPTQAWIAREMTARGVSISQTAISSWFSGGTTPGDLRTYIVLAQVLSWGERGTDGWVDPGWLAFGEDTDARPPALDAGGWTPIPQGP
jgi:hypothetical protein